MILCADGNYHLQKKIKKVDEKDEALSKGQGYFIPAEEVQPYLGKDYKKGVSGKTTRTRSTAKGEKQNESEKDLVSRPPSSVRRRTLSACF